MMAIWQRKPDNDLLWHTDRGSQYATESRCAPLAWHGIRQTMKRKDICRDNSVAESFFHALKTEPVHQQTYQTRAESRQAIFEYIGVFYNRERLLRPMTIGRPWIRNCCIKRLNRVSGKVLIYQTVDTTVILTITA